jgi:DivIVA domain-containing protein
MDVTPQELRNTEIKEAFRGYQRDEVNDLLERAAATIETLSRQLQDSGSRNGAEPALQVSRSDAETIQRTLLLAQRAADDAVAEAEARARRIVEDSESKAQSLVGDAEATARRVRETERRRHEAEVARLVARRDRLQADADALEAYATGYRAHVRAAIDADFERLCPTIEAPSPRPSITDDIGDADAHEPAAEDTNGARDTTSPPRPAWVPETSGNEPSRPSAYDDLATRPISAVGTGAPNAHDFPAPAADPPRPAGSWSPAPDQAETGWPPAPAASSPEGGAGMRFGGEAFDDAAPLHHDVPAAADLPFAADVEMDANPVDSDALDDDAFFASLRDAVRDDAPLGPDERVYPEASPFFDDADSREHQLRFRGR